VLDPALLRPGRFDRHVALGLPDRRGREAILRLHARSIPLADGVDPASLAAATPGFSGADLSNLVNEAALTAARRDARWVDRSDFEVALDRIVLGASRPILLGEREQRILAYHEAGHAVVAAFTLGADPLRKVSIVPRGMALGVTVQTPTEDHVTYGVRDLLGRLAVMMGGRAAELLVFDEASTGAQNDLKEATALARKMVGLWGMSEEIGPFFLGLGEEHVFLGRELAQERDLGQATLDRAEAAAQRLLRESLERAQRVLTEHRAELDRIAGRLIVEETLDQAEIAALIGAVPAGEPAPRALPVPA
jgi:cell division protease FtsH